MKARNQKERKKRFNINFQVLPSSSFFFTKNLYFLIFLFFKPFSFPYAALEIFFVYKKLFVCLLYIYFTVEKMPVSFASYFQKTQKKIELEKYFLISTQNISFNMFFRVFLPEKKAFFFQCVAYFACSR